MKRERKMEERGKRGRGLRGESNREGVTRKNISKRWLIEIESGDENTCRLSTWSIGS